MYDLLYNFIPKYWATAFYCYGMWTKNNNPVCYWERKWGRYTLQGFYKYFMVEVACWFACLSIIIWHLFMTAVRYVELCLGSIVIVHARNWPGVLGVPIQRSICLGFGLFFGWFFFVFSPRCGKRIQGKEPILTCELSILWLLWEVWASSDAPIVMQKSDKTRLFQEERTTSTETVVVEQT